MTEKKMVTAAETYNRQQVYLWSLVLSAVRIPHAVRTAPPGWIVEVPAEAAEAAREEIHGFEEENRNWPPPRQKNYSVSSVIESQPPVVLIFGTLIVFDGITGPWSWGSEWFKAGALSGSQVLEHGQWWRVVTALTLHADLDHLLGNVAFGGLLAFFLCRLLGSGLGWLLALLSGAAGNTISVLLRDSTYQAVGFSTMVFGMVGILSGLRLRRLGSWQEVLLSLGGALGLLAFLGTEGERTDLGSHLWGMISGIALGLFTANLPVGILRKFLFRRQWWFFLATVLIVLSCWGLALKQF
jgi:membrane associated rhomboid family serine protease